MSTWWEAEADRRELWRELLRGRPGDRERDLDRLPRLPRRLEGELEVEPLFLCLKEVKGLISFSFNSSSVPSLYFTV